MTENEQRLMHLYDNTNGFLRYAESRNGVFLSLISFSFLILNNFMSFTEYTTYYIPLILSASIILFGFLPVSNFTVRDHNKPYKRKKVSHGKKENILDIKYISKLDTYVDKDHFFTKLEMTEYTNYHSYLFDQLIINARIARMKFGLFLAALITLFSYIPIALITLLF